LGISAVYQEINLVPTLSVAENIFLGRQPMFFGFVNMRAANRKAHELLKNFGIDIDVTRNLSTFSIAIQQFVAIVRGIDLSAKVLILDEPTSSLDKHEVATLFSIIRSLKERGIGVILITHFLDQVYEISDRITVLRNGKRVGEHETSELPRVQLISEMLGKELNATLGEPDKQTSRELAQHVVFLQVQGFARQSMMEPFDLDIKKGEIVGLAGLLGPGRTETAKLIFGVEKNDRGDAFVKGEKVNLNSPRKAIQYGFGLCPEDRKVDGIIGDLTVRENIILALQAKMGWLKYLTFKKQQQCARRHRSRRRRRRPRSGGHAGTTASPRARRRPRPAPSARSPCRGSPDMPPRPRASRPP
jgi:simple sugar transport system ATP-binding protein